MKRVRWSEEEKKTILQVFSEYMDKFKLPSLREIQAIKKKYTLLAKRTSPQIKTWLHNQQKVLQQQRKYLLIYYFNNYKYFFILTLCGRSRPTTERRCGREKMYTLNVCVIKTKILFKYNTIFCQNPRRHIFDVYI